MCNSPILAQTVGCEPTWLAVELISSLLCNCDGGVRFCKPRPRRKPLEIRLFRSESLAGQAFLKVGSNRHFFQFWREMREDRREKPGDGYTPQNRASNRRKSIFEVLHMDVFPVN